MLLQYTGVYQPFISCCDTRATQPKSKCNYNSREKKDPQILAKHAGQGSEDLGNDGNYRV